MPHLFGPGVTVGEIAAMAPRDQHRTPEVQEQLDTILAQLNALAERCRRQSLSLLVPMGQEMAYRYQEALMADLLYALRAFRDRLGHKQSIISGALHLVGIEGRDCIYHDAVCCKIRGLETPLIRCATACFYAPTGYDRPGDRHYGQGEEYDC
jgi:hypothetical protein